MGSWSEVVQSLISAFGIAMRLLVKKVVLGHWDLNIFTVLISKQIPFVWTLLIVFELWLLNISLIGLIINPLIALVLKFLVCVLFFSVLIVSLVVIYGHKWVHVSEILLADLFLIDILLLTLLVSLGVSGRRLFGSEHRHINKCGNSVLVGFIFRIPVEAASFHILAGF